MPQIHPSQIQGAYGFESLYDQLKVIDTSTRDVDIEYLYNENGDVTDEVVWDMSLTDTPIEIKRITYSYNHEGAITTETLRVRDETYEKTFIYTDGVITKEQIRRVTV